MSEPQPPSSGDQPQQPPAYQTPNPPYSGAAPPPPAPYSGQDQYGGAPQGPRSNGLAIAALVISIIALLVAIFPFINFISILGGIAAIVLGIMGRKKAKSPDTGGGGMALTGIILGAISLVVAIAMLVFTFWLIDTGGGGLYDLDLDDLDNASVQIEAPAVLTS